MASKKLDIFHEGIVYVIRRITEMPGKVKYSHIKRLCKTADKLFEYKPGSTAGQFGIMKRRTRK